MLIIESYAYFLIKFTIFFTIINFLNYPNFVYILFNFIYSIFTIAIFIINENLLSFIIIIDLFTFVSILFILFLVINFKLLVIQLIFLFEIFYFIYNC